MNQDCFMPGNPLETGDRTIKYGLKTIEDCMMLCLTSSKCLLIEYNEEQEKCVLLEQDLNEIDVKNSVASKYASKSCITQSWYKNH